MTTEVPEVNQFWQEYRATVLRQGVPPARAEWFVRWAQRFARARPGVALRARTAAHVSAFLSDLARPTNVEPWQVEQAREALQVLYQKVLPLPWAQSWSFQTDAPEAPGELLQATSFHILS